MATEFRTADLSLAAVLWLEGLREFEVDKLTDDPADGRGVWIFSTETGLAQQLSEQYTRGQVRVEPKSFQRAIRKVREAMFEWRDAAFPDDGED
jgi:hypothetical protein